MILGYDNESGLVVRELIESKLITYKYYIPWCDSVITTLDNPPCWILELAFVKYRGDAISKISKCLSSESLSNCDWEMLTNLRIACLYQRYKRRELSWATFLLETGMYADGRSAVRKECEYFYELLNQYEDSYFLESLELKQSMEVYKIFEDLIVEVNELMNFFRQCLK